MFLSGLSVASLLRPFAWGHGEAKLLQGSERQRKRWLPRPGDPSGRAGSTGTAEKPEPLAVEGSPTPPFCPISASRQRYSIKVAKPCSFKRETRRMDFEQNSQKETMNSII